MVKRVQITCKTLRKVKRMPNLNCHTWDDWLKACETYWVALPIGDTQTVLHHSLMQSQRSMMTSGLSRRIKFASSKPELFVKSESEFLTYEAALKEDGAIATRLKLSTKPKPNLNVGSWWASIFDQTRFALNAVKMPVVAVTYCFWSSFLGFRYWTSCSSP